MIIRQTFKILENINRDRCKIGDSTMKFHKKKHVNTHSHKNDQRIYHKKAKKKSIQITHESLYSTSLTKENMKKKRNKRISTNQKNPGANFLWVKANLENDWLYAVVNYNLIDKKTWFS